MMMERAGLTKAIVAAPEAKPAELGAALDAIEDLYATLSFGGAARRHAAAHGAPGSEEEDGNNVLNEVVNVVEENIEDGADTAMNALGEGEAE